MDVLKIGYLKEWISQLPKGNISYKTIKNKKYAYLQWTENKKQYSRRVKDEELEDLITKINQRKELEHRLKEELKLISIPNIVNDNFFFSEVKIGQELLDFVEPVRTLKKRECFSEIEKYIYGNSSDRIFILYGLRRTGKTTLIRQLISEMEKKIFEQTAFIQVNNRIDLAKINLDLRQLKKLGYRYVFIDEVTLMDDFIEGASLFSDIFASSGMKIVLSGTDSLGFMFSEDRELYDRCYMTHTTFVPYREFENVLGIKGIDEYIRYGGTMSLGGIDYNNTGMTFASNNSTNEYIDSAIALNIQHSLKNYQNGLHFRNLAELYEANELTNVINRIVEDINHRFAIEILIKDFKSNDLSISAKNLLRDRNNPNPILYMIDKDQVTNHLKELLKIKNKYEQNVEIKDIHRKEIKEYLDLLDITVDIDIINLLNLSNINKHTIVTQPGLRYAQAEALIHSLMKDEVFSVLSLLERNEITKRILSDIQGRMMEDIVLLETKMAFPKCEVFKLVFARGEFDMVVYNPESASCCIYEVKHSKEAVNQQYQHLIDEEKCKVTEFRYGTISGKYVIYRGETQVFNNIQYLNVEEYLKSLRSVK